MQKPYWEDICGHGDDCYIASFVQYGLGTDTKYDIYVYDNDSKICLRYGEKPEEYISVGLISYLFYGQSDLYAKVIELLEDHGNIIWKRKEK